MSRSRSSSSSSSMLFVYLVGSFVLARKIQQICPQEEWHRLSYVIASFGGMDQIGWELE